MFRTHNPCTHGYLVQDKNKVTGSGKRVVITIKDAGTTGYPQGGNSVESKSLDKKVTHTVYLTSHGMERASPSVFPGQVAFKLLRGS